jgi:hypothetical protein
MKVYITAIFSNRRNLISGLILAATAKLLIDDLNLAESLAIIACIAFEGLSKYLESKKVSPVGDDLMTRISSLESKFNLNNLRK